MSLSFADTTNPLIVSVGSALVDMCLLEDESFLTGSGAKKGGMTLTTDHHIRSLLAQSSRSPVVVPGGSACNTIVGVGRLGGRARFIGKRGADELGLLFENGLRGNNVEPVLLRSPLPTGHVLSIITPDSQRSMYTYLGASSETRPEELLPGHFEGASVVHLEGYLLFNEELMSAALRIAKACGAAVSLDLASYTVVESRRSFLEKNVRSNVDILIANEDEARSFTGCDDEMRALKALSQWAPIAVLKIGKRGSYIARGNEITKVEIMGDGSAVDTTGAGDLWAAGFLYGLAHGFPIKKCGELGAACGYEVCQVVGAMIPDEGWKRIKNIFI